MICKNCRNHIFLTDEDNLPGVWSHLEETNCDDPEVYFGISFIWEDDCSEWNSQVNKAATHVGKYFQQAGLSDEEIKLIIGRFMDFITKEETK